MEAQRIERVAVLVTLITQCYVVCIARGFIIPTVTRVNVRTVISLSSEWCYIVQSEILVAKEVFVLFGLHKQH